MNEKEERGSKTNNILGFKESPDCQGVIIGIKGTGIISFDKYKRNNGLFD